MTDFTERIDARRARGRGLVRYDLHGVPAYGHQGGVPGFTTVALRTAAGRCVVLYENAYDASNPLPYRTPFILAAVGSA
jgi:D-alanyl-D-alanine carboxypeptidase